MEIIEQMYKIVKLSIFFYCLKQARADYSNHLIPLKKYIGTVVNINISQL